MNKYRLIETKEVYLNNKIIYTYRVEKRVLYIFWNLVTDTSGRIVEFNNRKDADLFLEVTQLLDKYGKKGKFTYDWNNLYFEGLDKVRPSTTRIGVWSKNRDSLLNLVKSLLIEKIEKNIIE